MLDKILVRICFVMVLLVMTTVPIYARTTDPAEVAFKEKFGQAVRDVRHTKTTADDAEFAQRLLNEANSGEHDPDLTRLIYQESYEFGLRDARGYQAANQALDKLAEIDESQPFELAEMRLVLFEKWYEAEPNRQGPEYETFIDHCMQISQASVEAGESGEALKLLNRVSRFARSIDSPRMNDVRDSITDLVRTKKILETIAELEEALGVKPTAADELALLYLAELDDPAKAVTYAQQISDQTLAANVRLAATDFPAATPEQANTAGLFYYGLATDNKAGDPIAMLIRARVWLTEYLSRDRDEAAALAQAQAIQTARETLGEIDQALLKRGIGKKLRRKMSSLVRGEGQFDRPADVQAAIDKAVQWLYTQHNQDRHWEIDSPTHRNWGGYTALVVYALLMADEEPKLNGDLSRAAHFVMNVEMKGTYALCFRIHAWEVLPRRERFRKVLIQDVNRLRRGATDSGYWGYTMSGHDVKPGTRVDTSTTLAGGLGLWIGEEVGGISPKKVYWERLARGIIDYQHDDKGWSYNPFAEKTGQGAMTAGALALLHASYPHLSEATKAKADEAIASGTQWMDDNFDPTRNVNRAIGHNAYYFAAVQHAGLFAGRKEFRGMDWYETIAEHLVKTQQPTGSWGSISETAFAIAFLCRGGIVYEESASDEAAAAQTDAAESTEASANSDTQPSTSEASE